MRRNEIICVGISVADLLGSPVREMPKPGRLVLVKNLRLAPGGCALNTSIGLARLGVKVGIFSRIGADPFGAFLLKELKEARVDTSGVKTDRKAFTSFTYVAVFPGGERAFLHTIGANAEFRLSDIDFSQLHGAKIVHVAGSLVLPSFDGEPTRRFLSRCRRMGLLTSLDLVWNDRIRNWAKVLEPCFPYLDFFEPNLDEAQRICGLKDYRRVARWLRDKGCRTVVLKMGTRGSYLLSDDEEAVIPAYRVKAVDATGAGDAFDAGFLCGILRGKSPVEAARLGNAVGAFCVQAVGCTTGIPDYKKVVAFQNRRRK